MINEEHNASLAFEIEQLLGTDDLPETIRRIRCLKKSRETLLYLLKNLSVYNDTEVCVIGPIEPNKLSELLSDTGIFWAKPETKI